MPAALPPTPPLDSQKLFRTVQRLGRGSYGDVWLVERCEDGRRLVAKYMEVKTDDHKYVRSEIVCMACCDHFAIVKYDSNYFVNSHTVMVVMEYADGGDLAKRIADRVADGRRPFTEHEIGFVFVQLCMAMGHVHRNKMLHRDIKPANVFFTSTGLVKLGDFGFSQQYQDTVLGAVATTQLGTPAYMAPEVWKGQRYGAKADVWSLGVILFEMMTLRAPFAGKSVKEIGSRVVHDPVPPLPDGYTDGLRDVVALLLSKDPEARPTCAELLHHTTLKAFVGAFELVIAANNVVDDATAALIQRNLEEAKAPPPPITPPPPIADLLETESQQPPTQPSAPLTPPPAFAGWVRKESRKTSSWVRCYLRVEHGSLSLAADPADTTAKPLPLAAITAVRPVTDADAPVGTFALHLRNGAKVRIQAASHEACTVWVAKIERAMQPS